MRFRVARLGIGDWLLAAGSIGLLVSLYALNWYRANAYWRGPASVAPKTSVTGWNGTHLIALLCVIVAVAGLVAVGLQLTHRSPALPTVTAVLLAPFTLLLVLALLVRELIDRPGLSRAGLIVTSVQTRPGAYLGLVFAVAMAAGTWLSLRRDAVDALDAPASIEVFRLSD
jgi:hypothetical protein